jgi:hypothetical protein
MGLPWTKSRFLTSFGTSNPYEGPSDTAHWVDREINGNVFKDARLG